MSNFGAHRLRLVNPYAPGFREAKSAVGASDLLASAEEFKTVAEAVADCALVVGTTAIRHRVLPQPPRRLDEFSGATFREQLRQTRVALLFGSEKIGLTNKDFSHCHWLLNIPTQQANISMNLGQSVAVCLYELARTTPAEPNAHKPVAAEIQRATAGEVEQITAHLLEALDKSFYVKPGTEVVCEKKVRRLLLRLNLETMDAKVFLGMMRAIVWKLNHPEKTGRPKA
jgi:tRNA/rRNA methyltransferase